MFEQVPNNELSTSLPLKVLAASAIGITLALGLCGAAVAFGTQPLGILALAIFGLSVLGAVISVVWLSVIAVINTLRN